MKRITPAIALITEKLVQCVKMELKVIQQDQGHVVIMEELTTGFVINT